MNPRKPSFPQPDGPALLKPGHKQTRPISNVAGVPDGWRVEDVSPMGVAHERGQLEDPQDKGPKREHPITGELRYLAFRDYRDWCEVEMRSCRDSTVIDIVTGGGGYPITEALADAKRKKISTESFLSPADRTIIRRLVDGFSLAGAVKEAEGERFVYAVMARIRSCLDALIEAQDRAKRSKWAFDMRRDE